MMRLILILLLLPVFASAQMGMLLASAEAEAAAATYPGDTVAHELYLWLWAEDVDGDGTSGNNSGDYQTWTNLVDGGPDPTQATTSARATYTSSHLNGYAAMAFDGNDYYKLGAQSDLDGTDEYTIFVVAEGTTGSGTDGIFQLRSSANNPALYCYVSHVVGGLYMQGKNSVGSNKYANQSLSGSSQDPFYGAWVWDSSDEIFVYANNATAEGTHTTGVNSTITTHSSLTVGAQYDSGSNAFNGYICELIVYKEGKSEAVREHILSWLKTRYNL